MVGEIELPAPLVHHRSVLWNLLAYRARRPHMLGLLRRLPRRARRQAAIRALRLVELDGRLTDLASTLDPETAARVSLAQGLMPGPRYLLIREPDLSLSEADLERFLTLVAALARRERLTVLASLSRPDGASRVAGRVLALADGLLVFDGSPAAFARSERWPAACGALRAAPTKA